VTVHDDAQRQAHAESSAKALFDLDRASQALGIRMVCVAPQSATVSMTVREDMTNGHSICHGGMIFTLADTAFALACNSGGQATVAASGSIDFLEAAHLGEQLTASARELWQRGRTGIYEVAVTNQQGAAIALFRGRSHRLKTPRNTT
jgi:acyl-CoA thioesterase